MVVAWGLGELLSRWLPAGFLVCFLVPVCSLGLYWWPVVLVGFSVEALVGLLAGFLGYASCGLGTRVARGAANGEGGCLSVCCYKVWPWGVAWSVCVDL